MTKYSKIKAIRYHDISVGHRVVGHEGKCRHLHGHNYRVHFHCEAEYLDSVGRVVDFGVIKHKLCEWLEQNWDHKFLAFEKDSLMRGLVAACDWKDKGLYTQDSIDIENSVVFVPFNPTAENMAYYLLTHIAPQKMVGTGVIVTKIIIDETRKCSVEVEL